jgi:hypothetical protein
VLQALWTVQQLLGVQVHSASAVDCAAAAVRPGAVHLGVCLTLDCLCVKQLQWIHPVPTAVGRWEVQAVHVANDGRHLEGGRLAAEHTMPLMDLQRTTP